MVKQKKADSIGVRLSTADQKIMAALCDKLGANITQVVRQSIRALAEKEGVSA